MSDRIIASIQEMIYQGSLQPGQKLPSERDLSRQMHVGRPTVREAIQHLARVGLLEIRPTVGTFVRSLTPSSLDEPLRRMLADELTIIRQFVDVRIALEGWSAAEAARHATQEDVDRIRALTTELEARAARGESLYQLDAAFHTAVLEATRNIALLGLRPTLASLVTSIQTFVNYIRWPQEGGARATHHRAIADAIAARDPAAAQHAMVAHLLLLQHTLAGVRLPPGSDQARETAAPRASVDTATRPAAAPIGSSR